MIVGESGGYPLIQFQAYGLDAYINQEEYAKYYQKAYDASTTLLAGPSCPNKPKGWFTLPEDYNRDEFHRIQKAADKIRSSCDILIVIGIGGSYLGARAAIEFVLGANYNLTSPSGPRVYFAGNTLDEDTTADMLALCHNNDVCLNVISKSGTTTEPAIAFRLFRNMLENKYGKTGARERIFVTTDQNANKSSLRRLSDENGYETFVVPDDIGGRYSVLTAVGLLPICAAGIDIAHMMNGAAMAKKELEQFDREDNMVLSYAAIRNALLDKGLHIEIFVAYRQCMQMFNEWLKQLFGESEGKEGKGIFPASVINTTDLHSMGQYIQEGQRILFETVIDFAAPVNNLAVPAEEKAQDGLEYLVGKKLFDINRKAMEGTRQAHLDGKVPNLSVTLQDRSSASFGYAVYFFELVCAISGYTLPIDPFNQPGVELYKKNMFRLLGKAGY